MNPTPSTMMHDEEVLIYDAVRNLSKDELEQRVRKNAAARNLALSDEHMEVIHTLVEHYQQDCKQDDCLAAHEHVRFLENACESKGGGKYLHMLFGTSGPEHRGVLTQIHELAELPPLRLGTSTGFGTAI